MTKVFAHRGASAYAPENTMAAFRMAAEQNADGVELDVQMTRDGELVVIHDETVDRVSDGKGYVKNFTLEELQSLSAHNHMEAYIGERIPTLKEVLELMKAEDMEVNIELKTGIFWYPDIEKKTAALVREMGMEKKVIYSSFNHYSIQKLKLLEEEAVTAYLFSDVILDVERYAEITGVQGLHPAVYHLKMADFLKRYQESPLAVRVWTVNQEEDIEAFMRAGVDAVITNYPDKAIRIREGLIEVC